MVPEGVNAHPVDEDERMNRNASRKIITGEKKGTAPARARTSVVPSPEGVKAAAIRAIFALEQSLIALLPFPILCLEQLSVPWPDAGPGNVHVYWIVAWNRIQYSPDVLTTVVPPLGAVSTELAQPEEAPQVHVPSRPVVLSVL